MDKVSRLGLVTANGVRNRSVENSRDTGWRGRCWRSFFFQAEDGIRDYKVTGVQTCALPILIVLNNDRPPACSISSTLIDERSSVVLRFGRIALPTSEEILASAIAGSEPLRDRKSVV